MAELLKINGTSELTEIASTIRQLGYNIPSLSFPYGFIDILKELPLKYFSYYGAIFGLRDTYQWLSFLGDVNRTSNSVNNLNRITFLSYPQLSLIDNESYSYIIANKNQYAKLLNLSGISYRNLLSTPQYFCYSLSKLKHIYLDKCKTIGSNSFELCQSLQEILLSQVEYLSTSAFADCTNLASVSLPNCNFIGDSAFNNCITLVSIDFPNCSYIGSNAFSNCLSLSTICFPKCEVIETGAFTNCTSLTSLYFGEKIPVVNGAFIGTQLTMEHSNISIYVPSSVIDQYKTADFWADLSNNIYEWSANETIDSNSTI